MKIDNKKLFWTISVIALLSFPIRWAWQKDDHQKTEEIVTTNFVTVSTNFTLLSGQKMKLSPIETGTKYIVSLDGTMETSIRSDRIDEDPTKVLRLEGVTNLFVRLTDEAGGTKKLFKVVTTTLK